MLDLILIFAFVAYAIYSGFASKDDAGKDLKEYFLAGKTLSGWKAGFSMAATQFAADTPLLVTGLIATGGVFLFWRLWIYGISFIVIGFIFSTKWRRAEVITDAELTEIRYSGNHVNLLRMLKALYYGTIINCVVLAMVLVAAMRVAEVFLPWHEWLPGGFYETLLYPVQYFDIQLISSVTGIDSHFATLNCLLSIFLVVGFTTMYSTTGGLRSVVATDMVQFLFAMIGTLFYAYYILKSTGGLSGMMTSLDQHYGASFTSQITSLAPPKEGIWGFCTIIALQWFFQMNSDGTGYLAQRSMACRTDRDARVASVVFTWAQVLFRSIIWIVIGLGLLVIYPYEPGAIMNDTFVASREMTFITGINDLLPPGIKGLMLVGILGALASTIDTHLNWGASYWSNDIYKELICKNILKKEAETKELVWVARLSNFLILFIALIIMFNLGSIKNAWTISLLFGAGMGCVLVLRWLWERITLYSELAAMMASIITAPLLLIFVDEEWIRMSIMATVSTLVPIIVALYGPQNEEEKLKSFYLRVKPQGFWRKTSLLCGELENVPLSKFKSSLFEILLVCASVFLILIGLVKLLFIQPENGPVPALITLVVGIIMIPFWYRKL